MTGAGQGNGAAIAKGLAEHGARVIVTDIEAEHAMRPPIVSGEAVVRLRDCALNITDAEACTMLAARVGQEIGDVSVLVNNAGIAPRHTIDDPEAGRHWNAALDVNLTERSTSRSLSWALARYPGRCINIASIASFVSTGTSVSYAPRRRR